MSHVIKTVPEGITGGLHRVSGGLHKVLAKVRNIFDLNVNGQFERMTFCYAALLAIPACCANIVIENSYNYLQSMLVVVVTQYNKTSLCIRSVDRVLPLVVAANMQLHIRAYTAVYAVVHHFTFVYRTDQQVLNLEHWMNTAKYQQILIMKLVYFIC